MSPLYGYERKFERHFQKFCLSSYTYYKLRTYSYAYTYRAILDRFASTVPTTTFLQTLSQRFYTYTLFAYGSRSATRFSKLIFTSCIVRPYIFQNASLYPHHHWQFNDNNRKKLFRTALKTSSYEDKLFSAFSFFSFSLRRLNRAYSSYYVVRVSYSRVPRYYTQQ